MPGEATGEPEAVNFSKAGRRIRPRFSCRPAAGQAQSECFCVRFSPDDQRLGASFQNGTIEVYNAETGALARVLGAGTADGASTAPQMPIMQLRWHPSGQWKVNGALTSVMAGLDGYVQHWDTETGACFSTIKEDGNPIFCLDYGAEGSVFATAGKDRKIRLYDEASKTLTQTLDCGDFKETVGHTNRVFSLKFHPTQPDIIITGGWDNTVQVWDARANRSVRHIWNCNICGDAVDFSAEGDRVLTGSCRKDDAVQIWSFDSGQLIESVRLAEPSVPGTCMPYAAQFSKDLGNGMILVGGSNANEARLLECPMAGPAVPCGALVGLPKPVFTVDFASSTRLAAVAGGDGVVRVLDVW